MPPNLLPYVQPGAQLSSSSPRRRSRSPSPAPSRSCPSCGKLFSPKLPPELFGRGRCPSCVDYDGPGRYAAALGSLRPASAHNAPQVVEPPLLSRLQQARADAGHRVSPAAASLAGAQHRRDAPSSSRRRVPPANATASRVPTIDASGEVFAAPMDRHRLSSKRKVAMLEYAHARASHMASPSATPEQRARLTSAVVATHELAEYGAATGTLDKDDHAWDYWDRFCGLYGWDPFIPVELARSNPHEVSQRLAIFQAWVYPQLRGRNQPDAKPRTVFNSYVLAIRRIFLREHLPMPSVKSVEHNLAGLMRTFKAVYGHEALMPGRKQPFTPAMWARIEALEEGTLLHKRAAWSPLTRRRDLKVLRIRFRMDGSDSQVCASQTQVIGGSRERSRQASASTRWEATGFLAAIQSAPDLSVLPRRIFEDRFVGSLCGSTNTSKCPENASQDTFGCTGADPTKRSHPSLLRREATHH